MYLVMWRGREAEAILFFGYFLHFNFEVGFVEGQCLGGEWGLCLGWRLLR